MEPMNNTKKKKEKKKLKTKKKLSLHHIPNIFLCQSNPQPNSELENSQKLLYQFLF